MRSCDEVNIVSIDERKCGNSYLISQFWHLQRQWVMNVFKLAQTQALRAVDLHLRTLIRLA